MNGLDLSDVGLLAPELALGTTVLAVFVVDMLLSSDKQRRWGLTLLALGGLLVTGWLALGQSSVPATEIFFGQVAVDPLANFFKVFFVVVTAVVLLTSMLSAELPDRNMGEYYGLLLAICFGMFVMAAANDLLMVYMGIELVSIVSYALAGYRLRDVRSSEAALKYVVYGGAASGLMLFGISLAYGMFGSTELSSLSLAIQSWASQHLNDASSGTPVAFPVTLTVSFVLIFAGVGYKVAAVPFHMWAPDVYEGAPTPFSGFLSVGPKAAGFALLMRLFVSVFVPAGASAGDIAKGFAADLNGIMSMSVDLPLTALLGIVAAATMTVGNLAAIPQNNVKRMLAYSSIAHAGYLLMGFVVLSESALHAVVFYLVIYFLMNVGAFTVCQVVRDRTGGEELRHFRGLGTKEPWLGVCMVIFLLSLTGVPPVAGFIAKFYLFAAVIERGGFWYMVLAVVAVLNSVVSLYYYMRVVRAMFLSEPADDKPLRAGWAYLALVTLLAVPTVVLCFHWSPLSQAVRSSIGFYRAAPAPQHVSQALTLPPGVPSPSE